MVRFYNWSLRFVVIGAIALSCFARVSYYPKGSGASAGMIVAVAGACPAGWSEYTAARGRYVVGVPSGGTVEATVGTALSDKENRDVAQHTHSLSYNSAHTHTVDLTHYHSMYPWSSSSVLAASGSVTLSSFGPTTQYASVETPAWSLQDAGETIQTQAAGTWTGTNAPYIQLRLCVKN